MKNGNSKAKLLLHVCCAPCLTSVWEELKNRYNITLFWFNPNIFPEDEYEKRFTEFLKYAKKIGAKTINGDNYLVNAINFHKMAERYKSDPEGGKRCHICIKYRLLSTAMKASELKFDYFDTTLTLSPLKDSALIKKIGKEIEQKTKVIYLAGDYKKNDGYKRSIKICKDLNIFRQKYCGCKFST